MATRERVLVCLLLLVLPLGTRAQQSRQPGISILIGGLDVRLGADQSDTLRRLAALYDVQHVDGAPGNWGVSRKGGPPYEVVGMVSFADQKLTMASKNWGPNVQSASALARTLHEAVRVAYSNQTGLCTVRADTLGNLQVQTVIQCGQRRLIVLAGDSQTNSVVNESISVSY